MKIKENKKSGFTLAEVLITLAIIGVVAALTLPTMIANHQKKVYVVQLQKAVSTLEQGFKMMMADDAVDRLDYTSLFQSYDNNLTIDDLSAYYGTDAAVTQFWDAWKNYFNISEISKGGDGYKYYFLDNSSYDDMNDYYLAKFADGMWLASLLFSATPCTLGIHEAMGMLYIDVNGLKGPNTYGRDVFYLYVRPDGTIEGEGDGTKETCTGSTGEDCSSYLMTNGWVMDY